MTQDQIPQIKHKNLILHTKQKALTNSDITGLVLKTPRSQIGHTED